MKSLFWGITIIILIGIGGFVYRNAVEHPMQPIACPLDAKVCPDGTVVGRTGSSCTFAECPLPNVSLKEFGISFAVPQGFTADASQENVDAVTYAKEGDDASTNPARITIRQFTVEASSTPLDVIKQTATNLVSGDPVAITAFSSSEFGTRRFTVVSVERFEGVIDTAYYLAQGSTVLRFDAIDGSVSDWTSPTLKVSELPAHSALEKMLSTLQAL